VVGGTKNVPLPSLTDRVKQYLGDMMWRWGHDKKANFPTIIGVSATPAKIEDNPQLEPLAYNVGSSLTNIDKI
jgi:hypothetical protein